MCSIKWKTIIAIFAHSQTKNVYEYHKRGRLVTTEPLYNMYVRLIGQKCYPSPGGSKSSNWFFYLCLKGWVISNCSHLARAVCYWFRYNSNPNSNSDSSNSSLYFREWLPHLFSDCEQKYRHLTGKQPLHFRSVYGGKHPPWRIHRSCNGKWAKFIFQLNFE